MMDILWRHSKSEWINKIVTGTEADYEHIKPFVEDTFNSTGLIAPEYEHIVPIARSVSNGHQILPEQCIPEGPHFQNRYSLHNFEAEFEKMVDINCLADNQGIIDKMRLSESLKQRLKAGGALEKLKRGSLCEESECINFATTWDRATGYVFCPKHSNIEGKSPAVHSIASSTRTDASLTTESLPGQLSVASMSIGGVKESLLNPSTSRERLMDDDISKENATPSFSAPSAPTKSKIAPLLSPSSLGSNSATKTLTTLHSSEQSVKTSLDRSRSGKHSLIPKEDDLLPMGLSQSYSRKVEDTTVQYLDCLFGKELWNDVLEDIELGKLHCTSKNHCLYSLACSYAPKVLVSKWTSIP